jgi:site-specific DNA recombinase
MSAAGIARLLNERGIPAPGVYHHERNKHRSHPVWTLRTVAPILANPRYTGRQVWNRQCTDHRETVPGDKRSSRGPVRIWNPGSDWVISDVRTHRALVSDADFTAVQQITALAVAQDGRVPSNGQLVLPLPTMPNRPACRHPEPAGTVKDLRLDSTNPRRDPFRT